jgi:hypothetical protein
MSPIQLMVLVMHKRELSEITLTPDGNYLVATWQGEEVARFSDVFNPHDLDNLNPAYLAFVDGFMRRFPEGSIFVEGVGEYLYSGGHIYYKSENRWETKDERNERLSNGGGVTAFAPLQNTPRYFK